ncbi:MAG: hypothetical protein ACJA1N_002615 [Saprospiraceae bacterium]|jgi:hypothetical protein
MCLNLGNGTLRNQILLISENNFFLPSIKIGTIVDAR